MSDHRCLGTKDLQFSVNPGGKKTCRAGYTTFQVEKNPATCTQVSTSCRFLRKKAFGSAPSTDASVTSEAHNQMTKPGMRPVFSTGPACYFILGLPFLLVPHTRLPLSVVYWQYNTVQPKHSKAKSGPPHLELCVVHQGGTELSQPEKAHIRIPNKRGSVLVDIGWPWRDDSEAAELSK